MTRYIKYEKSPGRKRIDGSDADPQHPLTITTIQAKVTIDEKDRLLAYCESQGISMSQAIREWINSLA